MGKIKVKTLDLIRFKTIVIGKHPLGIVFTKHRFVGRSYSSGTSVSAMKYEWGPLQ